MNAKIKRIGLILVILSSLFIPGLQVLMLVGINSSELIKIAIIILIIIFILLLILGLNLFYKNILSNKRKIRKWVKVIYGIFMTFYIVGCISFIVLLYGPSIKFKTWLITTAMNTMNHQYLCKWFYNDSEINDILSQNYVKESGESTDPTLIMNNIEEEYNEYEKELMKYKGIKSYNIVTFEVNGARAFMAAIYDPAKVKLEVTEKVGVMGEYVTKMAERNNAIMAINGGGFWDNGSSLGQYPTGITIKNKEIITNNEYSVAISTGGIVGLNENNVLVLLKNTTAEEAIEMGVRDAVSWGPFLIVNGVSSAISGNGGWGGGARSAIGQRIDGTILFLLVESNASRTSGAGMEDLVSIMERYGAYNASNLDGGTSSVLALPKEVAKRDFNATCHDYFTNYACAINDPIDSTGAHQTRYISDAWIVVE